ncbi:MAG: Hsp33 family molecular chaperone HslO [Candidatus Eremiobacteraeota bacterium]|nr:Hsp33 family molecular chaperone HslO [Candidatus Eremiobacteraeota bacterium]
MLVSDLLLSATAANSRVLLSAAVTTGLVREIQQRHDLWPTATAAAGRLATGAALFGESLKSGERVSLQIVGDGPLQALTADAWLLDETTLGVRGYTRHPHVDLPVNARGKFDVSRAIGNGFLQVTKSHKSGQPYVGVVPLDSGEVAEDIAVYLARSEQIPSVVALGVLANPSGVVAAGGILAQVLPGADERVIATLEERAKSMPPVTKLIAEGGGAEDLLRALASEELRSHRAVDLRFACLCTQRKVEAMLAGLGPGELRRMASERNETEAICEFCKRPYVFTSAEILALAEGAE